MAEADHGTLEEVREEIEKLQKQKEKFVRKRERALLETGDAKHKMMSDEETLLAVKIKRLRAAEYYRVKKAEKRQKKLEELDAAEEKDEEESKHKEKTVAKNKNKR